MDFDLRGDVHVAYVGDAMVLLDLAADSYLCLPNGAADLIRGADGAPIFGAGMVGRALAAAGLLAEGPRPRVPPPPPRPTQTVIHGRPVQAASLLDWGAALAATTEMRRIRPGSGVEAYLAGAADDRNDRTPARVAEAARTFWRLAPWLPIEGECLVRSALLMSFLRRRGLRADWVFGVRLFPFMAHCWVQADDLCLNDDVERLTAYSPIYCR